MNVTRTFRSVTEHPRQYLTLTEAEVKEMPRKLAQDAKPVCPGHSWTKVWYSQGEVQAYIVEIGYARGGPDFFLLPCSFEPKFGIDRFDGMLIEDVEAFSLVQRLGWKTKRLDIFEGKDSVDTRVYMKSRGVNI